MLKPKDVLVPLDVPWNAKGKYIKNFLDITKNSGKLMLFAGDQKAEHLNSDFYGEGISSEDNNPEHLFRIASKSNIGVFAAQLGLISKYGMDYKNVPYLVKLNSKSNLVKKEQKEPLSTAWVSVSQVVDFSKKSKLKILGVGYTIYLGSEFENDMLKEASQIINEAHKNGLITVIWIYPRGKAVADEFDSHLIAGACGVAACLGTDFVKVSYPRKEGQRSEDIFKEAVEAAGRTKVICAGGASEDPKTFLETLHKQINISGASGNATGRNVHQKNLDEAIRFCNAVYSITVEGKNAEDAYRIFAGNKPSIEPPSPPADIKEEAEVNKEGIVAPAPAVQENKPEVQNTQK
jgi:DhnA family fructose-bisphosphate aldolase class Ia